ncbi:RHS repeat-associated core domain-containing protein [Pseudomonas fluorescens]|jgi:RHS repeat-associated protein|uniref:RHS repeat-associated core domain-containing protein n=1 Tax=Pseudomonas TaxID=286 RepID=UPI001A9388D2|nr:MULTISPECIES: RHS repeat-associated core domain-containing protein [Pseudomonas]MDZ5432184.1 RHS repeat-associated core domain-containing protein [Pseudomonas fluorescens]
MLKTELCRYRYNALDQLIGCELAGQQELQRFYRHEHLTTELQGQVSRNVFQYDKQLLALQSCEGGVLDSQLLTTDQQRSVLQVTGPGGATRQVYTAYGHRRAESGFGSLLGFNGEAVDRVTRHYLLGNGHRAFNPVLMRFNSPDRLSSFGRGGWNAYAYCQGDPVNFCDPTGQFALDSILRLFVSSSTFASSVIALKPVIPFKLANSALANGGVFQLAAKPAFGAASSAIAGVIGLGFGVTGLASAIIAAVDSESALLRPLSIISAAFMAGAVVGRVGSAWAARDPKTIPALKGFVENKGRAVNAQTPSSPRPTAPPQTPDPFAGATAPPLTASPTDAPKFLFPQNPRDSVGTTARDIRRRSV